MATRSSDLSIKSIKTKPDHEKLSMNKSCSSEYYADASIAVPFRWESQPGTPKHRCRETSLPPLTPPPSYLFNTPKKHNKRHTKSTSLLHSVLPKLSFRKDHSQSTPATPLRLSPSSSSSFSVTSSPYTPKSRGRRGFSSSPASSYESRIDDEDDDGVGGGGYRSPVSALCFGIIGRRSSAGSCGFSPNTIKIMRGDQLA